MSPFLPDTWPFSLSQLPSEACLVGGSVRDQLLQRRSNHLDLDFVLPKDAVETARRVASAHNAGFVVLDEERNIARVVFDQVTVDFAQQQGESIEADLHRRDFTVNAIAYNPHSKTLIDPLNGQADISQKRLKMVSYQNLASDPLRLMRAYRQAAQLGFTVAPQTQAAIQTLAPQLSKVSIERVRSELDGILSSASGTAQLAAICEQQLLTFCLPHFDIDSVKRIQAVDKAMAQLRIVLPDYAERLYQWIKPVPPGSDHSWIKAVKLSCLLSQNSETAAKELAQLKYSRSETQVVLTLLEALPTIKAMQTGALSRTQKFFLFKKSADVFPAVSLLALATGTDLWTLQPLIAGYLNPADSLAHPPALLTGKTLIHQLDVNPGPKIGKILAAVEQAQAVGEINTQEEAISWATSYLQREH